MAIAADQPIRWGIIGTGGIAAAFAGDLKLAARRRGGCGRLAEPGVGRRVRRPVRYPRRGTRAYEALAEDPEIDAIYVATPHPWHRDGGMLGINAGKAVLVEKPFTINAGEARELIDAAQARGTFLMEAMWTRFLPHVVRIRELIAEGRLGDIRSVLADHGQWFPRTPTTACSHRCSAVARCSTLASTRSRSRR